jgi:ferritin
MANAQLAEKPPYLGLLNAISLAETSAGVYLEAWARATPDEDLACTLRLVAARETSHGQVFCRRIAELGYELRQKPDPAAAKRLAKLADPAISDLEKIGDEREEADPFREIRRAIANDAYDPMTANLLSWYIAEEGDSGRRLREVYDCVREKARGRSGKANGRAAQAMGPSDDAQAIMACMSEGFARLEKSFEKLARAVK